MTVDASTASAMKVRIDALKWVAGRRAPKRYGVTPASELEEELARLQAEKLRRELDPPKAEAGVPEREYTLSPDEPGPSNPVL